VSKRPALRVIAPSAVASILIVLAMLLIPSAYGKGSNSLQVSYAEVTEHIPAVYRAVQRPKEQNRDSCNATFSCR